MKSLSVIILLILTQVSFAQQNPFREKWNWLIGEWKGEGKGQPGQGEGVFSLLPDLNNNILIRRSHSEYPATDKKPKVIHDDLMIVYSDLNGDASRAIYFDNEGHSINYKISYAEKMIFLTSAKEPGTPVFRLVYSSKDPETISVKFEMSQDGEKFITYTEGICKKVK